MARAVRITLNMAMVKAIKRKLGISKCEHCQKDLAEHTWIELLQDSLTVISCSNNPR